MGRESPLAPRFLDFDLTTTEGRVFASFSCIKNFGSEMVKINVFNINQSQLAKHALKNSIACSDEYALLRSKLETLLRYLKKNSYWGLWQNVEMRMQSQESYDSPSFWEHSLNWGWLPVTRSPPCSASPVKQKIYIQENTVNGPNEQQLPMV